MAQESGNCDTAEGSGCQPQDGLVLCSNNCGFLGCAATMNLCAKCYMELTAKKQDSSSEMSKMSSAPSTSPVHLPTVLSEKSALKSPFSLSLPASVEPMQQQIALPVIEEMPSILMESPQPSANRSPTADLGLLSTMLSPASAYGKSVQTPTQRHSANRCLMCKKRIGLLAFKCRCGDVFCASHRYSDKHGCQFDYKSAGREAIAKANPVVIAKKVERI